MTGPLAPFADAYRAELRERGYTARSSVYALRQVAQLSLWLAAHGLTAAELNGARVDEFMVWQRADGRYRSQWSRPGLRCLVDVLRGVGVLAAEEPAPSSPTDVLRARFSAICLPSEGWQRARWRCTWRAWVGSLTVCLRTAGLPLWPRAM
jgi:hypothetical protein